VPPEIDAVAAADPSITADGAVGDSAVWEQAALNPPITTNTDKRKILLILRMRRRLQSV
jgi:hypothetical protein